MKSFLIGSFEQGLRRRDRAIINPSIETSTFEHSCISSEGERSNNNNVTISSSDLDLEETPESIVADALKDPLLNKVQRNSGEETTNSNITVPKNVSSSNQVEKSKDKNSIGMY